MNKETETRLKLYAVRMRKLILEGIYRAQSGHPGGSLSCTDILAYLYGEKMRVNPEKPEDPDRDHFVLSKGHCAPALYSALALRGFFAPDELDGLRSCGSMLQGHPCMSHIPGVDMSTGSLGQGIATAVGMAMAGKLDNKTYRVFSVLGDGELQEGEVWEASMAAAHYKLDNLTAFVDFNGLQIDGPNETVMGLGSIPDKFRAFGWHVIEIDGHSFPEIEAAVTEAEGVKGQPTMIIAHTHKGMGVSFMKDQAGWHGAAPNTEQYETAIADLNAVLSALEV